MALPAGAGLIHCTCPGFSGTAVERWFVGNMTPISRVASPPPAGGVGPRRHFAKARSDPSVDSWMKAHRFSPLLWKLNFCLWAIYRSAKQTSSPCDHSFHEPD